MTCETCEQRHLENESEPPCWKTGERCELRKTELNMSNVVAWNMYQSARSRIGHVLMELEPIELSPADASELAEKLRIIDAVVVEWERDEMKRAERDGRTKIGR